MATQDRKTSGYLNFLRRVSDAPRKFSLFALIRGAAARSPDSVDVGRSKLTSQDIVDLRQQPHVHFPGATIESVDLKDGKPTVNGYWLGLTGPMSPLPLHMTEYAMYEERFAKKRPFGDFLHLLAGRFLQLFYRAWAVTQPAIQADRPKTDRFQYYLGQISSAPEGATPNSPFSDTARLHYAALFASRRSPAAIEGGLSHLLNMPVEIIEFQPTFRDIEKNDQTRLGQQHNRLGDALVGARVYQVTDQFEAQLFPQDHAKFEALLPSGKVFALAADALTAFAPSHLEWRMTVCLPQDDVPDARLDGRSRLGWSSWLGKGPSDAIRKDVHLNRQSMRLHATRSFS